MPMPENSKNQPGIIVNKNGERMAGYTPTGNETVDTAILMGMVDHLFPLVDSHNLNQDTDYQAMIKRLIEAGENPFDEL
jgi:hypothetical protein